MGIVKLISKSSIHCQICRNNVQSNITQITMIFCEITCRCLCLFNPMEAKLLNSKQFSNKMRFNRLYLKFSKKAPIGYTYGNVPYTRNCTFISHLALYSRNAQTHTLTFTFILIHRFGITGFHLHSKFSF